MNLSNFDLSLPPKEIGWTREGRFGQFERERFQWYMWKGEMDMSEANGRSLHVAANDSKALVPYVCQIWGFHTLRGYGGITQHSPAI